MKLYANIVAIIALVLSALAPAMGAPAVAAASPARAASAAVLPAAGPLQPARAPRLLAPAVDIRVNAGGPDYTDSQGKLWQADKAYTPSSWGYVGGSIYTTTQTVVSTTEPLLYQTERYNMTQYLFDVANDVYEVELRFAELSCTALPCRSFGVKIQGVTVLADFAPFSIVGPRHALNTTFLVPVTANQIKIEFQGVSGPGPIVNAIRVTGTLPSTARNEARLNVGGYDYTDSQGNLWASDQPYIAGTRGYLRSNTATDHTSTPIDNTPNQTLFQSNRYAPSGSLAYAFDLPTGAYRVDLLFAEIYANGPNLRVFDVYAEGNKVLSNVDIFAEANIYQGITRTFTISTLLDAQLNITLTKVVTSTQPPMLSAVHIYPLDAAPPAHWANFSPTGWQSTQTPASSIQAKDDLSGLNVGSGQYAYSTNGGVSFSPWQSAATTGANGATDPQTLSVASVPFNQDSATQNRLKYRINDMSGNVGSSDVYTVPIDTLPPASSISSPTSGSLVGGAPLVIQGSASDAASGVQTVQVSTDGGSSWSTAAGTTSWTYTWAPPTQGAHNILSRATDNVGHIETPGPGVTITVDSVTPLTFIRTPSPSQIITSSTYLITGTAFDATSGVKRVELSLDNGTTWITTTGTTLWSYNWTPASQGPYTIRARAVDNAGNVDTPGTAVSVIVDRLPPTSTIIDPTPGRSIRGPHYTISGMASDDPSGSGLATVEVSTDGSTWTAASGLATWTYLWDPLPADGGYTVRSRARDQAGNLQAPPTSVTVTVDNAPPVSSSSVSGTSGSAGWYISPVTVNILASDATSGVAAIYYRLGAGSWLTYTAPIQNSTDGSYSLSYYAVDNAGNSETPHVITFQIDTGAPVTTAGVSGNGNGLVWYRSPVDVVLTSLDAYSGVHATYYNIDGGAWIVYSGTFTIAVEGSHTLQFYAVDNAGNSEAVHNLNLRIDYTAPASTFTAPTSGQVISGGSFTIRGTATDGSGSGIVSVDVSIDGGAWMTAQGTTSWSLVWTPPSPGSHNLRVRATDAAGNVENPGYGMYINVDTLAPYSAILTPYDGQLLRAPTVVVTGTASDPVSSVAFVDVSTNGGTTWGRATLLGGQTWVYTWTVSNDGFYNLRSRATDVAANVETPGSGINVQVDSIAPSSLILAPWNGQYIRGDGFTITGTASDIGSGVRRVEVSIDGGAWNLAGGATAWSYFWSPLGDDGAHSIRSRATDQAGNVENPGPGVTIIVDNGKPQSTILTPADGQVITDTSLLITGTSSDEISGVKRVELSLQRDADGYYWDGADWVPDVTYLPTDGDVSAWSYLWTDLPKVMMITIRSQATDNMGNVELPGDGVIILIQRGYTVYMPTIINDFNP